MLLSSRRVLIRSQTYKQQANKLAGQIAFLKSYSTSCAQETARDAVQVFGGRGITKTGMGRFIEHVRQGPILFKKLLFTRLFSSIIVLFLSMHSLAERKMSSLTSVSVRHLELCLLMLGYD